MEGRRRRKPGNAARGATGKKATPPAKKRPPGKRPPARRAAPAKRKRPIRRNVDQMRKDLEAASFSNTTFKFPAGLTKIRIVMPHKAERWYAPVTFGYIPDAAGKKSRVTSPKSVDSEAYCPLLETFFALKRMGRDDEASEIRPTSRYLVHAMVRTESNRWERKKIELPQTVWEPIARSDIDSLEPGEEDEAGFVEGGGIADPKTGTAVNVRRTGEGNTTKYSVTIGTKAIPVKPEWVKGLEDLEDDTIPTDAGVIEEAICEYLGLADLSELTSGGSDEEPEADDVDDEDDVGDDADDSDGEDDAEWDDDEEEGDDDGEYEDD